MKWICPTCSAINADGAEVCHNANTHGGILKSLGLNQPPPPSGAAKEPKRYDHEHEPDGKGFGLCRRCGGDHKPQPQPPEAGADRWTDEPMGGCAECGAFVGHMNFCTQKAQPPQPKEDAR